jgi:TRAP-type uncharacterized transport system fused permease subunit
MFVSRGDTGEYRRQEFDSSIDVSRSAAGKTVGPQHAAVISSCVTVPVSRKAIANAVVYTVV